SSINVIILSVIFVPPFFGFDTFMEAQDDYFVKLFTPLYKILSANISFEWFVITVPSTNNDPYLLNTGCYNLRE
ncbi:MAG: hypothetical protein K0B14_14950, partial [Anaerolineaceae bacterium]|nr:hypothetical protein [Anaerolineaceae bacterium]